MDESTLEVPQKATTVGEPWIKYREARERTYGVIPEKQEEISLKKEPWIKYRDSRIEFLANKAAKAIKKPVQDFQDSMQFSSVFNSLIQAESGGRHYNESGGLITSPVGARGITQIMPETAKAPGYGVTPLRNDSEEEYLRFGRDYLRAMVNRFDGDYRKAIASYNAGAGNVDKAVREANRKGGDWVDYLPKKSETIPYMDKILGTSGGRYGKEG